MTIHNILPGLALIFAVMAMIWPSYPLLNVAVIMLSVCFFIPR